MHIESYINGFITKCAELGVANSFFEKRGQNGFIPSRSQVLYILKRRPDLISVIDISKLSARDLVSFIKDNPGYADIARSRRNGLSINTAADASIRSAQNSSDGKAQPINADLSDSVVMPRPQISPLTQEDKERLSIDELSDYYEKQHQIEAADHVQYLDDVKRKAVQDTIRDSIRKSLEFNGGSLSGSPGDYIRTHQIKPNASMFDDNPGVDLEYKETKPVANEDIQIPEPTPVDIKPFVPEIPTDISVLNENNLANSNSISYAPLANTNRRGINSNTHVNTKKKRNIKPIVIGGVAVTSALAAYMLYRMLNKKKAKQRAKRKIKA